ncbi:MAG: ATPase [Bacteroidales bacterium]|jgi:glucosamine kinase|nr:ATPase [Bacteroidales bacterium]
MILIADSGSTNTDWVLTKNNKIISTFVTNGFNPYFIQSNDIFNELKQRFPTNIKINEITKIFFYGAGCSTVEMNEIVRLGLRKFFINSNIEINHDLLGAARALFMNDSGIAAILGTGASSCHYDGFKITNGVPSLGYVLGDEGGGDYLGKLFITDYLYERLPEDINQAFFEKYKLTNNQIMHNIYKEPHPNRFLASFCEFISEHSKDLILSDMINKSFTDLFVNQITKYEDYKNCKIRFVGSIAFYFKNQLKEVAKSFNSNIDLIERAPITRLAQYHFN